MNDSLNRGFSLPPEQQAIRDRCVHPSGTFVEFPSEDVETSIPERFEKVVRMHPDRPAIGEGQQVLTYAELNGRANRVARTLQRSSSSKGEAVLLFCSHGIQAVVGCMGILKAGKVVVAADSSFPVERIIYMMQDSGAKSIVTDRQNFALGRRLAPESWPLTIIDELVSEVSDTNPCLEVYADDSSQIVYSSGSTGKPKGVLRNHRRDIQTAASNINEFRFCPNDRFILFYSLSYSAGLAAILKGLFVGASLFSFDLKKHGLGGVADTLAEHEITCFAVNPSTFRYFMEEVEPAAVFPSVRVIELSGEPLARSEVESFRKHFSRNCALVSRYACSEAGNISRYYIDCDTRIDTPIVPVGYPVKDKEVLLVDDTGHEVGDSEIGEIAVRSRYLPLGYWNNPRLTREKFLQGARVNDAPIYVTGDIGRKLADGCLLNLGRKDDQIKIRGFRVQPNEVQAALLEHPSVKDAAVVARDREFAERSLVAYFVLRDRCSVTVSELREYLKLTMPDYMIPTTFIQLEALPLIANGKVDRRALPAPDKSRPQLDAPYVAPASAVEEELTRIWSEVLSLDQIGVHDNFFDLGGHSLAASRVISRVIQTFQLELPVKALFDAPTVAEMAAIITQNQTKRASDAELEQMLREVEAMTEDEAQKMLAI